VPPLAFGDARGQVLGASLSTSPVWNRQIDASRPSARNPALFGETLTSARSTRAQLRANPRTSGGIRAWRRLTRPFGRARGGHRPAIDLHLFPSTLLGPGIVYLTSTAYFDGASTQGNSVWTVY